VTYDPYTVVDFAAPQNDAILITIFARSRLLAEGADPHIAHLTELVPQMAINHQDWLKLVRKGLEENDANEFKSPISTKLPKYHQYNRKAGSVFFKMNRTNTATDKASELNQWFEETARSSIHDRLCIRM